MNLKLIVLVASYCVSANALDFKKINKLFSLNYKNVRAPEFSCPENMKKFSSKELEGSIHKFYEVACEDDNKAKYGLLFVGDVLTAIQSSTKTSHEYCKSKADFEKFYKRPGWNYKYHISTNFEKKYIMFVANYAEKNKYIAISGLCTKNKLFTIVNLKLKPTLQYYPENIWIDK